MVAEKIIEYNLFSILDIGPFIITLCLIVKKLRNVMESCSKSWIRLCIILFKC